MFQKTELFPFSTLGNDRVCAYLPSFPFCFCFKVRIVPVANDLYCCLRLWKTPPWSCGLGCGPPKNWRLLLWVLYLLPASLDWESISMLSWSSFLRTPLSDPWVSVFNLAIDWELLLTGTWHLCPCLGHCLRTALGNLLLSAKAGTRVHFLFCSKESPQTLWCQTKHNFRFWEETPY